MSTLDRTPAASAWHDAATIPDDRKDGREVLLWTGSPIVSSFDDGWRDPVGRPVQNATHWADVEGPGA